MWAFSFQWDTESKIKIQDMNRKHIIVQAHAMIIFCNINIFIKVSYTKNFYTHTKIINNCICTTDDLLITSSNILYYRYTEEQPS